MTALQEGFSWFDTSSTIAYWTYNFVVELWGRKFNWRQINNLILFGSCMENKNGSSNLIEDFEKPDKVWQETCKWLFYETNYFIGFIHFVLNMIVKSSSLSKKGPKCFWDNDLWAGQLLKEIRRSILLILIKKLISVVCFWGVLT